MGGSGGGLGGGHGSSLSLKNDLLRLEVSVGPTLITLEDRDPRLLVTEVSITCTSLSEGVEDLDEEEERPEEEEDEEEEEEEENKWLRRRDFLLFFSPPPPLPPRSLSCRLLCFRRFFLCDDL